MKVTIKEEKPIVPPPTVVVELSAQEALHVRAYLGGSSLGAEFVDERIEKSYYPKTDSVSASKTLVDLRNRLDSVAYKEYHAQETF